MLACQNSGFDTADHFVEGNKMIEIGKGGQRKTIRYMNFRIRHRMYVPGAEAADWGILLSFLVKTHAKTELLPESGGIAPPGAGGVWKV